MIFIIEFDYNFMEKFGGNALIGKLANTYPNDFYLDCEHKNILLKFPKPTTKWLEQNKNPHLSLVSSSFPICLLDDVLHLVKYSFKIEIIEYIKDPD